MVRGMLPYFEVDNEGKQEDAREDRHAGKYEDPLQHPGIDLLRNLIPLSNQRLIGVAADLLLGLLGWPLVGIQSPALLCGLHNNNGRLSSKLMQTQTWC